MFIYSFVTLFTLDYNVVLKKIYTSIWQHMWQTSEEK